MILKKFGALKNSMNSPSLSRYSESLDYLRDPLGFLKLSNIESLNQEGEEVLKLESKDGFHTEELKERESELLLNQVVSKSVSDQLQFKIALNDSEK